jgi:predicted DNA-binding transcriptional regulator AlpA
MLNLCSKAETAERAGLNAEYMMRLLRNGNFPKVIRIGSGPRAAVFFAESEVNEWLTVRRENPPRRGRPKGPEKPKTPTAREVRGRASLARLLVSLECKVKALEAKVVVLEGAA